MKNILFLFCLTFLFISCQVDEDLTTNQEDSINFLKIENVNRLSGEARLLAYKMLNS